MKENCDYCGDCFTRCQYLALPQENAKKEIKNLIEDKESTILQTCMTLSKKISEPVSTMLLNLKLNSIFITQLVRMALGELDG